jgi:hypothetical protein
MANLLNRKAVKEYIIQHCEKQRPGWDCTRVSQQVIEQINAFVKNKINDSIDRHPSKGKTFSNFQ